MELNNGGIWLRAIFIYLFKCWNEDYIEQFLIDKIVILLVDCDYNLYMTFSSYNVLKRLLKFLYVEKIKK